MRPVDLRCGEAPNACNNYTNNALGKLPFGLIDSSRNEWRVDEMLRDLSRGGLVIKSNNLTFWKRRPQANLATATLPPARSFPLTRYFALTGLAAFLLVAAAMLYFQQRAQNFHNQIQQELSALFAQVQDNFARRHDAVANTEVIGVHGAGYINMTRLLANALWGENFARFFAKAQRVSVDQCRAIADVKDARGRSVPPRAKLACYAGIGKQIMALPEFREFDTKVFDTMRRSDVFRIKVYDLRGITVYSSEHNQIGEDRARNSGWSSAVAGKPVSRLSYHNQVNVFEGAVNGRDLMESYVPLVPVGRKVVGVFETYSDVTALLGQIKNTAFQTRKLNAENQAAVQSAVAANRLRIEVNSIEWIVIVLALLALLYFVLLLFVRRAQRIIDTQFRERMQSQLALVRRRGLYAVLLESSRAMLRIDNRDELFATVCRIAVEQGGCRFAWIGVAGSGNQRQKAVAWYGEDAGYLDRLELRAGRVDAPRRSQAWRTLLSGANNVVINDVQTDTETSLAAREAARRAGVHSIAKFPIRQGGGVVGAINLYALEAGFFTKSLVVTLEEMANEVSFALDGYVSRMVRERAIQAFAKSESRYRSLIEHMFHGVAYCRMLYADERPQDYLYLHVNIAFEKQTGLTNVIGKRATEVFPGIREVQPVLFETFARVVLTGESERFETYLKPLDLWLSMAVYSTGEGTFVTIFDNINARKHAEQERRDYAGRLRRLARRLFTVEDAERRSINRELHDRIGQILGALNINLNIIRSQLPQQALDLVGARLADSQSLLEGAGAQVRDIMASLHPPALDDFGLLAALRTYIESLSARCTVPITLHGEDLEPRPPFIAETALFRIAQEALTNAVKHAQAKNIEVALQSVPGRVTLMIDDNGVGFDAGHPSPAGPHWGLVTMRERAESVGGAARIESSPGRGVHVSVDIPLSVA